VQAQTLNIVAWRYHWEVYWFAVREAIPVSGLGVSVSAVACDGTMMPALTLVHGGLRFITACIPKLTVAHYHNDVLYKSTFYLLTCVYYKPGIFWQTLILKVWALAYTGVRLKDMYAYGHAVKRNDAFIIMMMCASCGDYAQHVSLRIVLCWSCQAV